MRITRRNVLIADITVENIGSGQAVAVDLLRGSAKAIVGWGDISVEIAVAFSKLRAEPRNHPARRNLVIFLFFLQDREPSPVFNRFSR